MVATASHTPGTFCWIELCTSDEDAALAFYTALFGWTVRNVPIPGATYVIFRLEDRDVAAMYKMTEPDRARGTPSHWFNYVAVADADESAAHVAELGGTLHAGPMDVGDHGRMVVLQDPTGGFLGLWQAKQQPGVGVRDEPNSLCWNELLTPDSEASATFYRRLIGWETSSMLMPEGEYTVFMSEGTPRAGCMQITPEMGAVGPGWRTYFAVDDCDETVTRVQSLGGALRLGPETVPGVGRWAMFEDPTGAVFAAIAVVDA